MALTLPPPPPPGPLLPVHSDLAENVGVSKLTLDALFSVEGEKDPQGGAWSCLVS